MIYLHWVPYWRLLKSHSHCCCFCSLACVLCTFLCQLVYESACMFVDSSDCNFLMTKSLKKRSFSSAITQHRRELVESFISAMSSKIYIYIIYDVSIIKLVIVVRFVCWFFGFSIFNDKKRISGSISVTTSLSRYPKRRSQWAPEWMASVLAFMFWRIPSLFYHKPHFMRINYINHSSENPNGRAWPRYLNGFQSIYLRLLNRDHHSKCDCAILSNYIFETMVKTIHHIADDCCSPIGTQSMLIYPLAKIQIAQIECITLKSEQSLIICGIELKLYTFSRLIALWYGKFCCMFGIDFQTIYLKFKHIQYIQKFPIVLYTLI